jgi:hypothetical protein
MGAAGAEIEVNVGEATIQPLTSMPSRLAVLLPPCATCPFLSRRDGPWDSRAPGLSSAGISKKPVSQFPTFWTGFIEILMNTAQGIADRFMNSMGHALFAAKKRKISLFETETTAPGCELAFVYEARRRLGAESH